MNIRNELSKIQKVIGVEVQEISAKELRLQSIKRRQDEILKQYYVKK